MTGWTVDELASIEHAGELQLSSQRGDGSLRNPVTIWVVRHGDDLYVRSIHGQAGAWFRRADATHEGHISAGGIDRDVAFVLDTDATLNDRVDAAYRSKYHRYSANIVGSVVNPASRESTIKLVPH